MDKLIHRKVFRTIRPVWNLTSWTFNRGWGRQTISFSFPSHVDSERWGVETCGRLRAIVDHDPVSQFDISLYRRSVMFWSYWSINYYCLREKRMLDVSILTVLGRAWPPGADKWWLFDSGVSIILWVFLGIWRVTEIADKHILPQEIWKDGPGENVVSGW